MGRAMEQWPGDSPALNGDPAGQSKLIAAKSTESVDAVKEPCRNLFQRGGAVWIAELTGTVGVPLAIVAAQTAIRCQPKICTQQFANKFTKHCLVLVPSHMRRRGKEPQRRPPRPAVDNRLRLSDFVPMLIADYQGANGGITHPPA